MVRLASIRHEGKTKLVAHVPTAEGGGGGGGSCYYIDLTGIAPHSIAFFEKGDEALAEARELIASNAAVSSKLRIEEDAAGVSLLSPLDPSTCGKFLCIGMNYVDHCTEQNVPIPEEPVVFNKFSSSLSGPNDPIVCDAGITAKMDYEVELGFIVGKTVPRNTDVKTAASYVGGYTVVHDVSARDWQLEKNGGQWLLGKAQDGYGPIGPVIVTADDMTLAKVHDLKIACRVNGETLQDSSTSNLVHRVDGIISHLSKFMTLYPGDIVATGTPPGVGCFRIPPRWLQPGDVVECEIEGIGTLVNPVVASLAPPSSSAVLSRSSTAGRLEGLVCVVTGGARGIGYGIASRMGMEGAAQVTIVDLDQEFADDAAVKLQSAVPSCRYQGMACDVTDTSAVKTAWDKVASAAGRLDVLVQAAGVVGDTNRKCEDVDPSNFDFVMSVNVKGIFNGCKAALPIMAKQGFGRIVNIASIAGKEGNAGMLSYSTSKGAVIAMTKSIGKEYAESGITCNALAPAVVRTPMVDAMPPEQVKYMTDKIPMKRCGTIDEIASMVAFIASPDAAFTTGFCFDATGGRAVY